MGTLASDFKMYYVTLTFDVWIQVKVTT